MLMLMRHTTSFRNHSHGQERPHGSNKRHDRVVSPGLLPVAVGLAMNDLRYHLDAVQTATSIRT